MSRTLTWAAPSPPTGWDLTRIQRSGDLISWTLVATVPQPTTRYQDLGASDAGGYWYRVRAESTSGAVGEWTLSAFSPAPSPGVLGRRDALHSIYLWLQSAVVPGIGGCPTFTWAFDWPSVPPVQFPTIAVEEFGLGSMAEGAMGGNLGGGGQYVGQWDRMAVAIRCWINLEKQEDGVNLDWTAHTLAQYVENAVRNAGARREADGAVVVPPMTLYDYAVRAAPANTGLTVLWEGKGGDIYFRPMYDPSKIQVRGMWAIIRFRYPVVRAR